MLVPPPPFPGAVAIVVVRVKVTVCKAKLAVIAVSVFNDAIEQFTVVLLQATALPDPPLQPVKVEPGFAVAWITIGVPLA
jgi:hypothetical protein